MSGQRRAFGDDRLESRPDGLSVLTCPVGKGWRARTRRAQTVAEHPGTAVRWHEELYEVLEAYPLPEGGVRYTLTPWDERHAIRVVEQYDAPSEVSRAREMRDRGASVRKRRLSLLLAPLLGHLPGDVQKRMESEFGAPARAMTLVSALPLLVIGVVSILFFLSRAFGGGLHAEERDVRDFFQGWPIVSLPLAVYLSLESGIRSASAFLQARPMGSLAGALLYEIWAMLRGRRPLARPPASPPGEAAALRALEDRFRMIEPLLALLTLEEQELLERRFDFDALKWGRISVVALLAISSLNLIASLANFAGGADTLWDVLWLLAGGFLLLEQIGRRGRIAQGRPAGSILAAFVRPLAGDLLASAPANR